MRVYRGVSVVFSRHDYQSIIVEVDEVVDVKGVNDLDFFVIAPGSLNQRIRVLAKGDKPSEKSALVGHLQRQAAVAITDDRTIAQIAVQCGLAVGAVGEGRCFYREGTEEPTGFSNGRPLRLIEQE